MKTAARLARYLNTIAPLLLALLLIQQASQARLHRKRDSPREHLQAAPRDHLASSASSAQQQPQDEQQLEGRQELALPANQQQIIQMLPSADERPKMRPNETQCAHGLLTFELATGFIYKPASAADTLAMLPSTLQLTDCLEFCLQNVSCQAINFEMGLCVLLASSANERPQNLYSSQFPVFTIYAEKKCLLADPLNGHARRRLKCQRAWTFERVAGFEMKLRPKRRLKLATRELCMDACLVEQEFECRSANWHRATGECQLNEQDRHSVSQSEANQQQIKSSLSTFYGPAAPAIRSAQNQSLNEKLDLYENYPRSANSYSSIVAQRRRDGTSEESISPGSLSARLSNSWTSGKKHFKQLLFGRPNEEGRMRRRTGMVARQLASNADWSTVGAPSTFEGHYIDVPASTHVDYLENNCIYEPNKLCEFRKIQNRVLKTVDSIYQDVGSLEECKQKCLNASYRCYSFDYGDTSERVCRTSHLDQASLLAINEPYLEVAGAITYELASCYNVSIHCGANEMRVQVRSSKSFNGKIYAKSRPLSCMTDVNESLHFELAMRYHDKRAPLDPESSGCDVRASSSQLQGVFSNDIVIQHHDRIMTTQDVGLSVFCHYDLGNRSVSNNIELNIEPLADETPGEAKQAAGHLGSHTASSSKTPLTITGLATTVVRSPNVTMRITNMNGQPVTSATVGDRLALLFEVKEKTSPFGIFVREIVAMDGRQYLEHQHQLHRQHHSSAHSARPNHQEGDTDKPASPSMLYYSPSAAPSSPYADALTSAGTSTLPPSQTTHPQHGASHLNDSLLESLYQIDSVNSIQFIDSDGCPTEANLMGPIVKMDPHGHRLLAPFDAFKFPTSDMVFFRAVVTSCLAECKPAECPNHLPSATTMAPASSLSSIATANDGGTSSANTTPRGVLYSSKTLAHSPSSNQLDPVAPPGEPSAGIAQLLAFSGDK